MNKYTEIYGVDISKDVFDVMNSKGAYIQYANGLKGFGQFSKKLPKGSLVVMEATGYYHYRLAQYLYEQGHCVSVVNPLSVKRFIQMKLSKVKTDKSDARAICEYASVNEVPLYTAKNKKLALVAVSNKLLKQSFAIATSGLPYDEKYVSRLT